MNFWPITSQGSQGAAAGLLLLVSGGAFAVPGPVDTGTDWSRYQVILDRQPFGRVPDPNDPANGGGGGTEPEPIVDPGPALTDIVRLSVVTLYGGKPAAGFTDTSTGRSFYLFEGESIEDYTLVAVDASGASVTLRKGAQEAELVLGAATTASAVPAPAPVAAAAGPGDTIGYAARQRQRAEEARKRLEEARRRAEEERKNQAERVEQLTGEALQKHLRDYNLEMIRTGKGPPLPIELTPDEVAQLATEGFDVDAPPGGAAGAAGRRPGTPEAE